MAMRWWRSGKGDGPMAAPVTRVRRAVVAGVPAVLVAAGRVLAVAPEDVALSAETSLVIGNSSRVVVRTPPADPDAAPVDVPAPIGTDGTLLLDERVQVGTARARRDAKLRLLADVAGDLVATEGKVQLAGQAHVAGDVVAAAGVVAGIASVVDGGVAALAGSVRLVRLARVGGDVFASREFRGDRDVVVGAPGTTIESKGPVIIRDRGEYFATILHEDSIAFLGNGQPTLHASVVQVSPGTLAAPPMPAWELDPRTLPDVVPGTVAVGVTTQTGPVTLAPGRYGVVTLGQQAELRLGSGLYEIELLVTQSDARIVADVADAAARVELRVKRDVKLGRRLVLDLGALDEAERQARAARIRTLVGGTFRGDQDVVWAGGIAAGKAVVLGKHTTLTGTVWSGGALQVARDSTIVWVPVTEAVPPEYRPPLPRT